MGAKSKPKAKAKAKKSSPFKTRKTKTVDAKGTDTVSPPSDVAQAIDAFRECQEQAKHYEGEATVHKDIIMKYSQEEYSKRFFNGMTKSFKILGDETMVTYIMMDSSAGITEEEKDEFADKWGEKAAEDLIVRDFASIRFDPKVLEANYELVEKALQTLPDDVLENLFKPMLLKAKPGALIDAKQHAKSAEKIKEMLKDLKIKNYIR